MIMKPARQLPNLITLVNLLLGCLAIVFLFHDHIRVLVSAESYYYHGRLHYDLLHFGKAHVASALVMIAAVLDFADGYLARRLGAASAFGKQLDTLADLVTFGVVPGLMAYQLLAISLFDSVAAFRLGMFLFVPGLLIPVCGAIRLAKFSVDERQVVDFRGLPIPAAGLFIASLLLAVKFESGLIRMLALNTYVLYGVILGLSALMVSDIPMISLKFERGNIARNRLRVVLILVVAGVCGLGFLAGLSVALIPLGVLVYILFALAINLKK